MRMKFLKTQLKGSKNLEPNVSVIKVSQYMVASSPFSLDVYRCQHSLLQNLQLSSSPQPVKLLDEAHQKYRYC